MSSSDSCEGEHSDTLKPSAYSEDNFRDAAGIFRALADVSRLRILEALACHPCCVSELAEASKDEISTVSQRLRVLRSERLVRRERSGKHMIYSLADHHVMSLVMNALEHVTEE